jgi:peroxiredoxin
MKAQALLTLTLAGSVTLNVALAHKLRRFNHVFSPTSIDSLQTGITVPAFEAIDLEGRTQMITYNRVSKPTVLYVFTPSCSWCARNMDNFKTLIDKESSEYRFIGISLADQGLADYVRKNELNLPIYSGLSAETLKAYRLGSTPQTIVISPEGKVLQDWAGAYVGDQRTQIEAFFRAKLPGIKGTS